MDFFVVVNLIGDAVVAIGVLGVLRFGVGVGVFEGLDHASALLDVDGGVFGTVKDPDGDLFELLDGGGIASAGDGDAGGEEFGFLGEEVEGAVGAHGVSGEVDAVFVDGEFFDELFDDLDDAVGLIVPPSVFIGALGGDDEALAFAVVVLVAETFDGPGDVGGHDVVAFAVEIDDEGVAGVLALAEFAVAVEAVFEAVAFGAFPVAGEQFGEFLIGFLAVVAGGGFLFLLFNPGLICFGEFAEVEGEGAAVAFAEDGDFAVAGADVFGGDGFFAVGCFPLAHFREGRRAEEEGGGDEEAADHGGGKGIGLRRGI